MRRSSVWIAILCTVGIGLVVSKPNCNPSRLARSKKARTPTVTRGTSRVTFSPETGTLGFERGTTATTLVTSLEIDGIVVPLHADKLTERKDGIDAAIRLSFGQEQILGTLHVDSLPTFVRIAFEGRVEAPLAQHQYRLRIEQTSAHPRIFVSGYGWLQESRDNVGKIAWFDEQKLMIVAKEPLSIGFAKESEEDSRLAVRSVEQSIPKFEMSLAIGEDPPLLFQTAFSASGEETSRVRGSVHGMNERTRLLGLDSEFRPILEVPIAADGRFQVDAPKRTTEWVALTESSTSSETVHRIPGDPGDLILELSPGGTLDITVTDPDLNQPLLSRIVVTGIRGTLTPSFGPDYRASGAGPLADIKAGAFLTPIPAGHYRVLATKGIEYNIDAVEVLVQAGKTAHADLRLRHVVPTPDWVGCDLHVHARPSFDTPVLPEDRVMSLIAAGIDFAVPTEHNIVGTYGPALAGLDLVGQLAYVTGIEVTTFNPRFGHFGVFPYPLDAKIPPYRKTTPGAVFRAVRKDGDPNRILQVNHPHLDKQIGYFEMIHLDPKSGAHDARGRMDFDALEVLNGFEMIDPSKPERVMNDYFALLNRGKRYVATASSDSHRIQYVWAGYPRTYVHTKEQGTTIQDPLAVVSALKHGEAMVSAGPLVLMDVGGVRPGGQVKATGKTLSTHLRILAAPWIDVRVLELIVNGKVVTTRTIPKFSLHVGKEEGSLEEAQSRSVRFEGDLSFPVGENDSWVVARIRGETKLDAYLPITPMVPLAFTNPVWIARN